MAGLLPFYALKSRRTKPAAHMYRNL